MTALVDTSGATTATYEYSPFGVLLRCEGEFAKANPFRFSSKFTDDETGLLYYGYRFCSPTLGRWISRDPLEEGGGENLYGFVGNNSISQFDHLGMFSQEDEDELDQRLAIAAEASGFIATYAYDTDMLAEHLEIMEQGQADMVEFGKEVAMAVGMQVAGGIAGRVIGAAFGRVVMAARVTRAGAAVLPAALRGGAANVHVYYGLDKAGNRVYAGITDNIARRQAQHGGKYVLDQITKQPLTRGQARAVEQALIKRNPGFNNARNEISPNHPWYNQTVEWGEEWLRTNGL